MRNPVADSDKKSTTGSKKGKKGKKGKSSPVLLLPDNTPTIAVGLHAAPTKSGVPISRLLGRFHGSPLTLSRSNVMFKRGLLKKLIRLDGGIHKRVYKSIRKETKLFRMYIKRHPEGKIVFPSPMHAMVAAFSAKNTLTIGAVHKEFVSFDSPRFFELDWKEQTSEQHKTSNSLGAIASRLMDPTIAPRLGLSFDSFVDMDPEALALGYSFILTEVALHREPGSDELSESALAFRRALLETDESYIYEASLSAKRIKKDGGHTYVMWEAAQLESEQAGTTKLVGENVTGRALMRIRTALQAELDLNSH